MGLWGGAVPVNYCGGDGVADAEVVDPADVGDVHGLAAGEARGGGGGYDVCFLLGCVSRPGGVN